MFIWLYKTMNLMKVIPVTCLMKVIPVTYLMKVIPVTYLMKVIPEKRRVHYIWYLRFYRVWPFVTGGTISTDCRLNICSEISFIFLGESSMWIVCRKSCDSSGRSHVNHLEEDFVWIHLLNDQDAWIWIDLAPEHGISNVFHVLVTCFGSEL